MNMNKTSVLYYDIHCSKGHCDRVHVDDTISKDPVTENELHNITQRLYSAHTRSSAGGKRCHIFDDHQERSCSRNSDLSSSGGSMDDDVDVRSRPRSVSSKRAKQIFNRLHNTQTESTTSRTKPVPKVVTQKDIEDGQRMQCAQDIEWMRKCRDTDMFTRHASTYQTYIFHPAYSQPQSIYTRDQWKT